MKDALTFKYPVDMGGVPVVIYARAFIGDDSVLAIRSVFVLDADEKRLPSIDVGKADDQLIRTYSAAPSMREMLLRLEWSGHNDQDQPCCPVCEFTKEPPPWPIPKPAVNCHAHDCALAALFEPLR